VAKRIANASRTLDGGEARSTEPLTAPGAPKAAPGPASSVAAPRPAAPERRAPAPLRSRALDAFRRLRGVTNVAQRAWIVCLGYRRWRYELAHPRAPNQALPLGDALTIANECLNPYAFLLEG
jgi:hypothetical protein